MTTYQELMLSVCFGATMGYLLFGLGMMIHEAVYFIKKKVKAHKEKKNQQNADGNERTGDNRVIAHLARESWRAEVFKNGGDIYCTSASQMFHVPVEKHGINGHLRQKGKIADLALGYGGSVGALKAMGALEMGLTEDELQPLVDAWRQSNPNIVALWWDFDTAIKNAIKMHCSTASHSLNYCSNLSPL